MRSLLSIHRSALCILLAVACGIVSPSIRAEETAALPPAIASAHRIVVLGDSITYAGIYVDDFEAAVRLAQPSWDGCIVEVGLPSETVSGLSEDGHAGGRFPRPDLHERLGRVLAQLKPELVIACYGMNDGIYYPFAEERFAKYREGIEWLHRTITESHAAIIHLTPPVFDPSPVRAKVLPAGLTVYREPYAGYNDVLDRYSAWLMSKQDAGWVVVDVHSAMNAALAARRASAPGFTFARKDGVHPDANGHAVIAAALLHGLGFRPEIADEPLRWANEPRPDWLRLISERRKLLSDAWLTATGHKRPGMAHGKPLAQAETEAETLDREIRAQMAGTGTRD